MPAFNEITPIQLMRLAGLPEAPVITDVRTPEDDGADPRHDAFYRWAHDATEETHNWPAGKPA